MAKSYNSVEMAEYYLKPAQSALQGNLQGWLSTKVFFTTLSCFNSITFPSHKSKALDIGCTSGRYTNALLAKGFEAVGIDVAKIPLNYALKWVPDSNFILSSATDLPFKKESFDLVLCMEVFHYFTDEILERVLEEISEVIKLGGIFVSDVKNKMNPIVGYKYKKEDTVECTLKARTIRMMAELVEKRGFEIIKKRGILFPITLFAHFVLVFARKEE